MKKVELLAPAKDKKTAIAAINSGCDALYIGASNFGARKKVPNSLEDIKEIVDYAHRFYVKVHVTVNTILTDNELVEAQELIQKLYDIGVDAIIVQDMGIFKLAIDGKLPPIVLHASTQCDNRTLEKVKFFKELGVSRVILARELSVEQIKNICSPRPGEDVRRIGEGAIEVETFVHGALCVSYSGQCYLSYYIGGRSANRGECAQACRKKYTLVDDKGNIIAKDKYLLSMKDFNASEHLKELIDSGIKSFKIEGRLKDENYVKNVVAYYRREIDKLAKKTSSGKVFLDFEPDVKKSFNRGFTDYFLDGRKNPSTADAVPLPFSREVECIYNFDSPKSLGEKLGKITHVGRDYFEIGWQEGNKAGGQADFGKQCPHKNKLLPCLGKAGDNTGKDIINNKFRCNSAAIYENSLPSCLPDFCSSDSNQPRQFLIRQVHSQDGLYFNGQGCLVNKVEGNKIYPNKMDGIAVGLDVYRNFDSRFEKQLENSKTKRKIGVRFIYSDGILKAVDEDENSVVIELQAGEPPKNPDKMKENFVNQLRKTGESDFYAEDIEITGDIAFMPVSKINELRRNILDLLMAERLKNYKREIQKPLKYAEYPIKKLDYRANIHNKEAKSFYENCGCEVSEMSLESNPSTALHSPYIYKKSVELMRTKHCLKFAFNMCKSPKQLFLIDERGQKYPLQFDCKNCEMVILNSYN